MAINKEIAFIYIMMLLEKSIIKVNTIPSRPGEIFFRIMFDQKTPLGDDIIIFNTVSGEIKRKNLKEAMFNKF